jgi:uncharacterized repeat protein (TIGR01451 family)
VAFGAAVTYTIAVHNNGPDGVTGASLTDGFPASLSGASWTCSATAGSSCPAASGTGNITAALVNVANGGNVTFTASAAAAPATKMLPLLTTLDTFNRANATTLGGTWTQPVALGSAAIRANTNQALCSSALACPLGPAYWTTAFLAKQGAAYTFVATAGSPAAPLTGSNLLMAATGPASGGIYPSDVRVLYTTGSATIANTASVAAPAGTLDPSLVNNSKTDTLTLSGNSVVVSTTTNGGGAWTDLGSVGIPTGAFATGNTLSAVINSATGSVDIWKTNGGTTYLGSVAGLGATFTAGGRIGMLLPNTARVDDFKGGTVP